MGARLRVVLVHDSTLVRSLLRQALQHRDVSVVAETGRHREGVALCRAERPDVVLCAAFLGEESTHQLVSELSSFGAVVLVLADQVSPEAVLRLLRAGASGFLSTDVSLRELLDAVVAVRRGEAPLDPRAAATLLAEWRSNRPKRSVTNGQLSARELEVLRDLSRGLTTKAIAHSYGLSVKTIESHKSRLFAKLGVRTQAEAVAVALGGGLVTAEDHAGDGRPTP
jgi:two-component system response regulator NreC